MFITPSLIMQIILNMCRWWKQFRKCFYQYNC